MLQHDREGAAMLGRSLSEAVNKIRHCERCNTFSEQSLCDTCASTRRDPGLLCVVETPADQLVLEQTLSYSGSSRSKAAGLKRLIVYGPSVSDKIERFNCVRSSVLSCLASQPGAHHCAFFFAIASASFFRPRT
ncbi:MAG: hypothetical protein EB124_10350 [Betaproteobacteria bacterium]|nr:hypothetical protein [Betaproteobacteria bacterium]